MDILQIGKRGRWRLLNLLSNTQPTLERALGVCFAHRAVLPLGAVVCRCATPGVPAASAPPLSAVFCWD